VRTLAALSELGAVATRVIDGSKNDLIDNLHDLGPAVGRLADAGKNLTESVSLLASFPFPSNTAFPAVLKGDYGNLYLTLDLSTDNLARNFGLGFNFPGMPLLGGLPPLGAGQGGGNPLELPFLPSPPGRAPAPSPVPPIGAPPPTGVPVPSTGGTDSGRGRDADGGPTTGGG
jgi:phospholipid/cholesterol/gamma-HCH transport system substrate-binding protein